MLDLTQCIVQTLIRATLGIRTWCICL